MNSWLKVALYAFIGAVIGSFLLGIVSTGNGMMPMAGSNYGQGMPYMNSNDYMQYGAMNGSQMPMRSGMMGGMRGGMGMMRR